MKFYAIEKNEIWKLVEKPQDKEIIGVKWIYKVNLNQDGLILKKKVKLIAEGYSQQHRIDYNKTFAPIARFDIIITLIAMATQKGWNLYQLDVKSTFLNEKLKEDVYV